METQAEFKPTKFGLISDTHHVPKPVIEEIVYRFQKAGVHAILHCGDIEPEHVDAKLFGDLPVICALVDDQTMDPGFVFPPKHWCFTKHGDRVRNLGEYKVYVGHRRSFRAILNSINAFNEDLDAIGREHNGLRLVVSGHSHNQILYGRENITFINPGAAIESLDCCSHEYAIYDYQNRETVFGRIPRKHHGTEEVIVGVIADSEGVALRNTGLWKKLADEFKKRGVGVLIHCGNIDKADIGRPELENFVVYYPQSNDKALQVPDNWKSFSPDKPTIEIGPFRFLIQHDLGVKLLKSSESEMELWCIEQTQLYGRIDFVLTGTSRIPLLEENLYGMIVSPGSILAGQKFVTIGLPDRTVAYSNLPYRVVL